MRTSHKKHLAGAAVVALTSGLAVSVASPSLASSTAPVQINMGGGGLTDSNGPWSADTAASGGWTFATKDAIAGTVDPARFQDERAGLKSYDVPVSAPGVYRLSLDFAEIYWEAAGARVFSVQAEGVPVVQDLDIFGRVGGNRALTITRDVTVTDGVLNLGFSATKDQPTIAAVSVKPVSTAPTPAVTPSPIPATDQPTPYPGVPAPTGRTYYVSPSGSDSNPGTQASPWRTFGKAAATLVVGDHAVFGDGTYNETTTTSIAKADGLSSAPIVFRAQNPGKAVINYQGLTETWKLQVTRSHVTIAGFSFTQPARGRTFSDSLIRVMAPGTSGVRVTQNRISNSFQAVKIYGTDGFVFDRNEIVNSDGAFSAFNAPRPRVLNNVVRDFTGIGMVFKGGTRSALVSNNVIVNESMSAAVGLNLGGQSCGSTSTATCGNFDPSGYEAYDVVANNNVVRAAGTGAIDHGVRLQGCGTRGGDGCGVYNNVISGARWGLVTLHNNGTANGWGWAAPNRDPQFYNNIVTGCRSSATSVGAGSVSGQLRLDNNLFHLCAGAPTQVTALTGDPMFVDPARDWHLRAGSPAAGKGRVIAGNTGFFGEVFDVSRTFEGSVRSALWNAGVY